MHDSTRSKPAWKRRLLGLALSTGVGFSGMVGATEVNTLDWPLPMTPSRSVFSIRSPAPWRLVKPAR